jgi:hypothetical protein
MITCLSGRHIQQRVLAGAQTQVLREQPKALGERLKRFVRWHELACQLPISKACHISATVFRFIDVAVKPRLRMNPQRYYIPYTWCLIQALHYCRCIMPAIEAGLRRIHIHAEILPSASTAPRAQLHTTTPFRDQSSLHTIPVSHSLQLCSSWRLLRFCIPYSVLKEAPRIQIFSVRGLSHFPDVLEF